MLRSIDQMSRLYELQSNKQGYKRCVGREEKVGNIQEIRTRFHYQLQNAYHLAYVNSEEALQVRAIMDLYSPTSASSRPTKCHHKRLMATCKGFSN